MRKTLGFLLALVLLILVCGSVVLADSFVNGNFEAGNLTGWTANGGTWTDTSNITTTGDTSRVTVNAPGLDARTNNNLNMVYNGNYAAQINNYGNEYHWSQLSQTVNDWSNRNIYFAWAAVLDEPTNGVDHPVNQTPRFSLSLIDVTKSLSLYNVEFDVYNPPTLSGGWHTGADAVKGALDGPDWGTGVWKYSDWQVADLDTSAYIGDTFTMTVQAYDCGIGGHGGYAYVDQFGGDPPNPNPTPEPGSLALMALGLPMAGLWWRKRRS